MFGRLTKFTGLPTDRAAGSPFLSLRHNALAIDLGTGIQFLSSPRYRLTALAARFRQFGESGPHPTVSIICIVVVDIRITIVNIAYIIGIGRVRGNNCIPKALSSEAAPIAFNIRAEEHPYLVHRTYKPFALTARYTAAALGQRDQIIQKL